MMQLNLLSEREKEVVEQLLQGKSNKLIALELGISARTVEFHLKNIYAKYQVSSRVELILKLGDSPGKPEVDTPQLGDSTVELRPPLLQNEDTKPAQRNWATCIKQTIYKEFFMINKNQAQVTNAILWASAILASALVGAPTVFTIVLLPVLGMSFILATNKQAKDSECNL